MSAKTIPILPSRDFSETADFYAALAFREVGRWPREYLILRRDDGLELHFWNKPQVDAATNDVACYSASTRRTKRVRSIRLGRPAYRPGVACILRR